MQPLNPSKFGLLVHLNQQFRAYTPADATNEELVSPDMWASIGSRCKPGDHIYCLADDFSYEALLTVTYSAGQRIRVKMIWRAPLDVVETTNVEDNNAPYFVKQRGVEKWCIIERASANVMVKDIPTRAEAEVALADYLKALAA